MPTTDSYGQGVSLISLTDAPDMAKAIADLAAGVIPRGVMRFASASARGATLAAPVEGMTTWLQDANRLEVYDGSAWVTPEPSLATTTSGLSAAAGFSVIDFFGHRQGRVVALDLYLTRTGANIPVTNGNVVDLVAATVPSAWRPTHSTITGCWDSGVVHGGFVIGTDGVVTIRTATHEIDTGTNLRFHITFLRTT
jgi:hypothetical protein